MKTKSTFQNLFIITAFVIACSTRVAGQSYTENFDNVSSLFGAGGWDTVNRSNPSTTWPCWFRGLNATGFGFNAFNGNDTTYIASNHNSTTFGGTLSSWLIAPERTLRNGDVFSFFTRELYGDGLLHSKFEFRLSTNATSSDVGISETSTGDFSSLLTTVDFSVEVNYVIWTQHTVAISGLSAPTSGRVAFRNISTTTTNYFGIDSLEYTSVCNGVSLSPISLGGLDVGLSYFDELTLLGATGTTIFTLDSGTLPSGVTLTSGGVLSGVTDSVGTFVFQITATDSNSCSSTIVDSITIGCAGVNISLDPIPLLCTNSPPFVLPPNFPSGGYYTCNHLGVVVDDTIFVPSVYEGENLVYHYADQYGCTSSISQIVSVETGAQAVIDYLADDYCLGVSLTLYNAGSADSNYFANGILNLVPFTPPTGIFTYYLYAYNFNGCVDSTSYTVTIHDVPIVTCTGDITVNDDAGQCGAVVNFAASTATGIADITYSDSIGSFFQTGITNITATATNLCGTDNCTFSISVNDTTAPLIDCPLNLNIEIGAGLCSANGIVFIQPIVSDMCSSLIVTNDAPTSFPVGVTSVTWTAEDDYGNTATCIQTVTVVSLIDSVDVTICGNQNIVVGAHTYNSTGVYLDTLTSATSCDSIVRTNLFVFPQSSSSQNQYVCYGLGYTINGNTYTTAGTYTDTLISFAGCDSIVTTNLFVIQILSSQNQYVCSGMGYTINGNIYTTAGTYTDTLISFAGCDSVVTTNLFVIQIAASQNIYLCPGGSYSINGNTYTMAGNYNDTLVSFGGCDSLMNTIIYIVSQIQVSQNILHCDGSSYFINGNFYNVSGIYIDTLVAFAGCDSVVTTNLIIDLPIVASGGSDVTMCFGDSILLIGLGSGGSGSLSFAWLSGSTFDTTSVVAVSPADTTMYEWVVSDGVCFTKDTVYVNVNPSTNIHGQLTYPGGPLQNGLAELYKWEPFYTHFQKVDSVALNAFGYFHFSTPISGSYIIRAFPDQTIYLDTMMSTYYGDVTLWDSALIAPHGCVSTDTFNIQMHQSDLTQGNGFISGVVREGVSYRNQGDPIPNVTVKGGHHPGGQGMVVFSTNTQPVTGSYSFSNVPVGCYTIYVDIPGLGRDTLYDICITATDTSFTGLDYCADSASIYTCQQIAVGTIDNTVIADAINIYPNPSSGKFIIENKELNLSEINITNVVGEKIFHSILNQSKPLIEVDLRSEAAGIYFIQSTKTNGNKINKKIIIR